MKQDRITMAENSVDFLQELEANSRSSICSTNLLGSAENVCSNTVSVLQKSSEVNCAENQVNEANSSDKNTDSQVDFDISSSASVEISSTIIHIKEHGNYNTPIEGHSLILENEFFSNNNLLEQQCNSLLADAGSESRDQSGCTDNASSVSLQGVGISAEEVDDSMQCESNQVLQLTSISSEETSVSVPDKDTLSGSNVPLLQNANCTNLIPDAVTSQKEACEPLVLNAVRRSTSPRPSDTEKLSNANISALQTDISFSNAVISPEIRSSYETSTSPHDSASSSSQRTVNFGSNSSHCKEEPTSCVLDLVCDNDSDASISRENSLVTSRRRSCLTDDSFQSNCKQSQPAKKRKLERKGRSKQCAKNSCSVPAVASVNPEWLKPFELGWRREIVIRKDVDSSGSRPSDVYYYAPSGKKLRSMREILQHLKGEKDLLDGTCFTFSKYTIYKEPFEIVRTAGESGGRSSRSSPNKQQSTSVKNSPNTSANMKRSKLESDAITLKKVSNKLAGLKVALKKRQPHSEKVTTNLAGETQKPKNSLNNTGQKLCGWNCPGSEGVPPSLPCDVCMCMFHPACVGIIPLSESLSFTCQTCKSQTSTNSIQSCPPVHRKVPSLQPLATPRSYLSYKSAPKAPRIRGPSDMQPSVGTGGFEFRAPPPLVLAPSVPVPLMIPMSFVQPICIPISSTTPLFSKPVPVVKSTPGLAQFASVASILQDPSSTSRSSKHLKLVLPSNISSQLDIRKPLALKINGQQMLLQPNEIVPVSDGLRILLPDRQTSGTSLAWSCTKPSVTSQCAKSEIPACKDGNRKDVCIIEPNLNLERSYGSSSSVRQSPNLPGVAPVCALGVMPAVVTVLPTPGTVLFSPHVPATTAVLQSAPSGTSLSQAVVSETTVLKNSNSNIVMRSEPVIIPVDSDSDTDCNTNLSDGKNVTLQASHSPLLAKSLPSSMSTASERLPSIVSLIQTSLCTALTPSEVSQNVSLTDSFISSIAATVSGPSVNHSIQDSSTLPENIVSLASESPSPSLDSTITSSEVEAYSCCDVTSGNREKSLVENGSESSLSRSKHPAKRLKWSGFGPIHAGYNSMLTIFQYLGVCDLLRVATVCTTWRSMTLHPDLWKCVKLRGCHIKNWQIAAAHFHRMNTRQLDMKGMIHHMNNSRIAWQLVGDGLSLVSSLQVIDFGQCCAKVVLAVVEKLVNLRSITAELIPDPSDDVTPHGPAFDLAKFSTLHHLECLKLRGASGLSFPVYSDPSELQKLSTLKKLKNLSLTTLRNVEGRSLNFIGAMHLLTTLELGSCYNWTEETYRILTNLVSLKSLRLENGGDFADVGLGSALRKMTKLEYLELIRYFVADNLAIVFPTLSHLKSFFIWPEIHEKEVQVGRQNSIILSAVSGMSFLRRLFWGITLDSRSAGELPTANSLSNYQPKIPFLLRGASGVLGDNPSLSMRLLTINDIVSALSEHLPDTKIQVFQIPVKDQGQRQNS